jgi:hypothetical protein
VGCILSLINFEWGVFAFFDQFRVGCILSLINFEWDVEIVEHDEPAEPFNFLTFQPFNLFNLLWYCQATTGARPK